MPGVCIGESVKYQLHRCTGPSADRGDTAPRTQRSYAKSARELAEGEFLSRCISMGREQISVGRQRRYDTVISLGLEFMHCVVGICECVSGFLRRLEQRKLLKIMQLLKDREIL